nr:hypothetical protein [Sphingomonas sp. Y57]
MPKIYVIDVPEFSGLVRCAREQGEVRVTRVQRGYFIISSARDLVFHRRACGFKPAVWYTCLSGGIEGRIAEYGRDVLRVEDDAPDRSHAFLRQ